MHRSGTRSEGGRPQRCPLPVVDGAQGRDRGGAWATGTAAGSAKERTGRRANPYTLQLLALTDALRGDVASALAHLSGIRGEHTDNHLTFHLAESHALTGDLEHAASLVAVAVGRGFFPYAFIALHNPFMRRLHGVPQYEAALREAKRKWQEFRG
jgi:hypothetical protein